MLASRLHLAVLMLVALSPAAHAGEVLPGPMPAKIVSVYNGDTITVRAHIWLGQDVETKVRLDGIDTPEINGKCDAEKTLAVKARDFLAEQAGDAVMLTFILGNLTEPLSPQPQTGKQLTSPSRCSCLIGSTRPWIFAGFDVWV